MANETETGAQEYAALDESKIKKLRAGEICGTVATAVCALDAVYFIVCFAVATAYGMQTLKTAAFISAPIILGVFVAAAAFCNLKYGRAADALVRDYVIRVFVENASLMHPERSSISYFISLDGARVTVSVNGYKEKIVFDFSAFGRLSPMRKLSVLTEIENRLTTTFCKLVLERGVNYKEVNFREIQNGKTAKSPVAIIAEGIPDKKAVKSYLKNSARNSAERGVRS